MSKELDEIRLEIARWLGGHDGKEAQGEWGAISLMVDQLLSLSTDTCRIAVVRKEGELPENPYHPNPLREYDHQITEAGMIGYGESQMEMLKAGYRLEVKE